VAAAAAGSCLDLPDQFLIVSDPVAGARRGGSQDNRIDIGICEFLAFGLDVLDDAGGGGRFNRSQWQPGDVERDAIGQNAVEFGFLRGVGRMQ